MTNETTFKHSHTTIVTGLGNQFIATICRDEVQTYGYGTIPAKIVAINWFATKAEAEAWASEEFKKHN